MSIEFKCLGCDKILRVVDEVAGKKARCPECGTIQMIFAPPSPTASVPTHDDVINPQPISQQSGDERPSAEAPPSAATNPSNPFLDGPISAAIDRRSVDAGPNRSSNWNVPFSGLSGDQARMIAAPKVKTVAWLMLILNAISLVAAVGHIALGFATARNADQILFTILFAAARGAMSAAIMVGSWNLLTLRSYVWAMTASILSLFPCNTCCFLTIPLGAWGLIVLSNPIVQRAFQSSTESTSRHT